MLLTGSFIILCIALGVCANQLQLQFISSLLLHYVYLQLNFETFMKGHDFSELFIAS